MNLCRRKIGKACKNRYCRWMCTATGVVLGLPVEHAMWEKTPLRLLLPLVGLHV